MATGIRVDKVTLYPSVPSFQQAFSISAVQEEFSCLVLCKGYNPFSRNSYRIESVRYIIEYRLLNIEYLISWISCSYRYLVAEQRKAAYDGKEGRAK